MANTTIVAELSGNHLGAISRAVALIRAAKDAGADAVKFQCWHPERMVVTRDYVLDSGPWKGRNLRDLYAEAFTPWEWFPHLFDYAKEVGIELFASVFDVEALAFLEGLGCPRYKIASFEITDTPLIAAVARTGKPIVISTGMATGEEVRNARDTAVNAGSRDVTLLKCTSAYPAPTSEANLKMIDTLWLHSQSSGLSDHTLGTLLPIMAATMGAKMLEKHLTLSRADGGPDAGFSTEPAEFKDMVEACRDAEAALGEVRYGPTEAERASLQFRRSLWVCEPIRRGERFTERNVMSARPAVGLPPSMLPDVLGRQAARDLSPGEPVLKAVLI